MEDSTGSKKRWRDLARGHDMLTQSARKPRTLIVVVITYKIFLKGLLSSRYIEKYKKYVVCMLSG